MRRLRLAALAALVSAGCAHDPVTPSVAPPNPRAALEKLAHTEGAPIPAARSSDVESLDAILHALYDAISGPAGSRDWDRLRSLFVPGARLIPIVSGPPGTAGASQGRAIVLDVPGYIALAAPAVAKQGFFEREIARRVEQFGDLAQVFSTYESRHAPSDPKPFQRGINAIQLLQSGGRWWLVTVYWQDETPERPLPAEYLH